MNAVHGPTVLPVDHRVNHPGIHGRYLVIDLDANNRHAIREAAKRRPAGIATHLGFGVCRQGFGLQDLPSMDAETAQEAARALNGSMPVGVVEPVDTARERLSRVRLTVCI